jgi:hypothetical protein
MFWIIIAFSNYKVISCLASMLHKYSVGGWLTLHDCTKNVGRELDTRLEIEKRAIRGPLDPRNEQHSKVEPGAYCGWLSPTQAGGVVRPAINKPRK